MKALVLREYCLRAVPEGRPPKFPLAGEPGRDHFDARRKGAGA